MKPGGEGAPPPPSNGDGWIHGLLTGAEKFLNAVLGSGTPSSSSSSTSYSMSSSEEKGGNGSLAISTTRNDDFNLMERDSKMVDCLDQDLAVVSEIDSKQAIEQLLMEETFSREECNNLVGLIQSRVIDLEEEPRSGEKDKTPSKLGSSLLSPKFLSLGSSPYHSNSQECAAINEARKWIEAKKSPGVPCMLNTNVLEFDPQTGSSPAEVAREYMNSLPTKNCAKVFERGYESSTLGISSERTKRLKFMLIEGSLNLPKFKQLDVNAGVQSSYQSQASIGVNDTPILTAIPLNPADLHVSKSYQIYDSKGPQNTDQVGNAWVPYATCATDVPEIQPTGCVPSTEMGSAAKLVSHEGIISTPNTSRRGRGGRAGRGRGRGGRTGNGVTSNSTFGTPNNDGTEESPLKSSTPRPRRGRGRGRGAKPN